MVSTTNKQKFVYLPIPLGKFFIQQNIKPPEKTIFVFMAALTSKEFKFLLLLLAHYQIETIGT